jgi:hypothetical protein
MRITDDLTQVARVALFSLRNLLDVSLARGRFRQPCLKPLDLNQSDEAILASIATETVLPLDIPF